MSGPVKEKTAIRELRWAQTARATFIALAAFMVYLPVLKAGYIWDDDTALTENPLIRSLSGLYDIWFTTKPYDYFPLTFTSFWLEWRLWGMNATGYHVVNVLLHALGAILFWRVLLRLKIPGALLAAMVFEVHPVCVASVAWIAERKNTLSLVFYLLSFLWYLRFDSESRLAPHASRRFSSSILHPPSSFYCLSLLAFLLALLSKTSVVTLPLVLRLCVWWRRSQNSECGVRSAPPCSPAHPPICLRICGGSLPFLCLP
jgi:protein O-mannosyl-transferase